eukprot:12163653-Karenia_brevis.AAC.1
MTEQPKEEESSSEWEGKVDSELGALARSYKELKKNQGVEMRDLDRAYQRIQNLEASLQERRRKG